MDHLLTNKKHYSSRQASVHAEKLIHEYKKHSFYHSLVTIVKPIILFILGATLVSGIVLTSISSGKAGFIQGKIQTLTAYYQPLFSDTLDFYRIIGEQTENIAAFALGGLMKVHEGLSN